LFDAVNQGTQVNNKKNSTITGIDATITKYNAQAKEIDLLVKASDSKVLNNVNADSVKQLPKQTVEKSTVNVETSKGKLIKVSQMRTKRGAKPVTPERKVLKQLSNRNIQNTQTTSRASMHVSIDKL
jgi:hypothetical protein